MTEVQPMLVFSISYLAIFFLLMGALPLLAPNLLYAGKEYSIYTIPNYFSSQDIENIVYLEGSNLTFPHNNNVINFNPDINVKLFTNWIVLEPYISLAHITWELYDGSFPWISTFDYMYFYSINNTIIDHMLLLGKPELENTWNSNYNASVLTAKKDDNSLKVKVWFTDTNQTRNNISNAWDDGAITIAVGFGMDDVETSYNAWNLIGIILTFQRPDVFGVSGTVALLLNAIINSTLFFCIAYLIFYFITSIIPLIKGA